MTREYDEGPSISRLGPHPESPRPKGSHDSLLPPAWSQTDPLIEFASQARRELRLLLRLLAQSIPWAKLLAGGAGAQEVEAAAAVAVADIFGEPGDERYAKHYGGDRADELRKTDAYEEVSALARQAIEKLAGEDGIEQLSKLLDPVVARQTLYTGLFASDPRTRMAALDSFNDRVIAKKGRDREARVLELKADPAFLEIMKQALALTGGAQGALEGAIDAEVIPLAEIPEKAGW